MSRRSGTSYTSTDSILSDACASHKDAALVKLCTPLHPRFAALTDRLMSFDDPQWPSKCPVTPADLAAAGFYYYGSFEGITDSVKCFYCDAGLCLWEKDDDVWFEHRRVSPKCPFVLQFHPEIVRQREADEKRRIADASRDPNEVVDDWMTGLMIVQFLEKNKVSRTQVRNILYQRWLNHKTPFESMAKLQEAVEYANQKLEQKYNPNSFWLRNLLRGISLNKRSKKNSSGSESSQDDESCLSGPSSSQSSQSSVTDSEYSSYSSISSQSSEEEGSSSSSSSRLLCKVCLDNKLEVVFIPCGHFVCCSTCSQSLSKCPYCRKRILSAVKTYLS